MKESNFQFQLVDTTYELPEAREVLLSLINDKIKFINMTIFSREERFGDDCLHLRKRVAELTEVKSQLLDYFMDIPNQQTKLKIDCPVNISLETEEMGESKSISISI